MSNFDKIVCFGDIHGCFEPLKNYFDENPFSDSNFYIFLGDYFSRGLQYKEVIDFLYSIIDKKNVILLIGNHEEHLEKILLLSSKCLDFSNVNLPRDETIMLQNLDLDYFKKLKAIIRKCGQLFYFKYEDCYFLCTHGGMPVIPDIFTSAVQIIRGVGKYEESDIVDEYFCKNNDKNFYSIHGHRNVYNVNIHNTPNTFNLCDEIEFGGYLRVLEILPGVKFNELLYKNTIFKEKEIKQEKVYIQTKNELYKALNESYFITKKILDKDIISYNFSRNAFDKGIWNKLTVKARGLFINSKTQNVTCRSWDKFFNIEEQPETEIRNLKSNLKFPLIGYKKENGFLGLVSWDKDNNELFVASKSTNQGDFANIVKEQFNNLNQCDKIVKWLKNNNYTLVFEVIDIEKDPHIIKYDKSKLVLLDIIENRLDECEKIKYSELQQFSIDWNLECKKEDLKFENWEDFFKFYNSVKNDMRIHHEGWVFEDQNQFMFKYKTAFYKYWKYMRSIKDAIVKGRNIRQTFSNQDEVEIIDFMKRIDIEELNKMSIIDVRDNFLKEKYDGTWCPQGEY